MHLAEFAQAQFKDTRQKCMEATKGVLLEVVGIQHLMLLRLSDPSADWCQRSRTSLHSKRGHLYSPDLKKVYEAQY